MNIVFTRDEWTQIRLLNDARQVMKGDARNHRVAGRPDEWISHVGLIGEAAVAKALRVPVRTFIGRGGDDGADLQIGRATLEVKFASRPDALLYFAPTSRFVADIAVLVVPARGPAPLDLTERFTVRLAGWTSRVRFQRCARLVTMPYNRCLALEQAALDPIVALFDLASRLREEPPAATGGVLHRPDR